MTTVISLTGTTTAEKLNDRYGLNWLYIGWTSKRGLPRSPLAQPLWSKQKGQTYRQWLWHQMQIGNPQVINLLRSIKNETVLVDDNWNAKASVAHIVIKAARWLQSQK